MELTCLGCAEKLFTENILDEDNYNGYEVTYVPNLENVEIKGIDYGHYYDCSDSSALLLKYACKKCNKEGEIDICVGGQGSPDYKRT